MRRNSFCLCVGTVALIGLLTITIVAKDHAPHYIDRGFALLLLAALLLSPLGWIYYLWIVVGPLVVLIHYWYNEESETKRSTLMRIRNSILFISCFGVFLPLPVVVLHQPSLAATVTYGSSYFWTFLFLWLALIADWFIQKRSHV